MGSVYPVRTFVKGLKYEKFVEKNTFYFADVANIQYILIADMPEISYLNTMMQSLEWKMCLIDSI